MTRPSIYWDRASLSELESYVAALQLRLERVEHTSAERRAGLRQTHGSTFDRASRRWLENYAAEMRQQLQQAEHLLADRKANANGARER